MGVFQCLAARWFSHIKSNLKCYCISIRQLIGHLVQDSGKWWNVVHYNDVIMGAIASQITSLTIVFSTVYSDGDQRKHQSSASPGHWPLCGDHRGPVNSPPKWPVTRKMFPFDDIIMSNHPQNSKYGHLKINGSARPKHMMSRGNNLNNVISQHMLQVKSMSTSYEIAPR